MNYIYSELVSQVAAASAFAGKNSETAVVTVDEKFHTISVDVRSTRNLNPSKDVYIPTGSNYVLLNKISADGEVSTSWVEIDSVFERLSTSETDFASFKIEINKALQDEIDRAIAAEAALGERIDGLNGEFSLDPSKTIKTIAQTRGKLSVEEQPIQVGMAQVTGLGTEFTNVRSEFVAADGALKDTIDSQISEVQNNLSQTIEQNQAAVSEIIADEVHRAQTEERKISDALDAHEKRKDNPHEVTKAQVGLGNADNTADIDKPISTATQEALNNKLNTSGGIIAGNLTVEGDLTVTGTETVNNIENLNVKDQMIYSNSTGATLSGMAGLGIKTDNTSVYGIVYDPAAQAVKLGLGSTSEEGKFSFAENEGSAIAVRAASDQFAANRLVKFDTEANKLVDAGKSLDDITADITNAKQEAINAIPTDYIVSGEQTAISDADQGINTFTFTTSQGRELTFQTKNGSKGSAGPQGEKGDPGAKGDKGDIGPTGPQGPAGVKGDRGEAGETGSVSAVVPSTVDDPSKVAVTSITLDPNTKQLNYITAPISVDDGDIG